jgi:glycosyltransferase involved in cell wall biosynthesis
MRVAIVHEYLTKMGGAERVLKSLLEIYPQADVYCLQYDEALKNEFFGGVNVFVSGLQKYPKFLRSMSFLFVRKNCREIEKFDLSEYDLVISSSNSYAHGVVTSSSSLHVCYYHSPTRFLWDWKNEYLDEKGWTGIWGLIVDWIRKPVREWDFLAAQRPDVVLANSEHVKKRIKKYYRREAEVVYPPVSLERFKVDENVGDYFLIVSTLTRYKRIDVAVEAFKELGWKLKIIGNGADRKNLEEQAKGFDNIEFLGFRCDEEVAAWMRKCRGLVFCSEEDFGITPVEVLASGRPVVAYGKGGLLETVEEGKTGLFFGEQTPKSLMYALGEFEKWENKFEPAIAVKSSKEFGEDIFKEKIVDVVNREMKNQVNI